MEELKTFLIATSPLVELRGAIPIALEVYHLPLWSAYLWSVLGNIVPLFLIAGFGEKLIYFFAFRWKWAHNLSFAVFEHTRHNHQTTVERLGKRAAVLLLTATPIPFVGGWTGAIAAVVFGLKFREAFPLLLGGVMIAGIIVSMLTLGISAFI